MSCLFFTLKENALVNQGHHNEVPQQGSLDSPIPCLQSWRLDSQTRVWAGLVLLRPLSWACGRPSPPRVLTGSSVCVCLCPELLFL